MAILKAGRAVLNTRIKCMTKTDDVTTIGKCNIQNTNRENLEPTCTGRIATHSLQFIAININKIINIPLIVTSLFSSVLLIFKNQEKKKIRLH